MFMLLLAAGSIAGTYIGSLLVGLIPSPILLPLLVISAIKIWSHK